MAQLLYLHVAIEKRNAQGNDLLPVIGGEAYTSSTDALVGGSFNVLAQLELYTIQRRYHQANMSLMSRVWVRYLGFVTGMALALIGATFILGKMREPEARVNAGSSVMKFSFAGASPGIFLVLAGLVLMLATILVRREINVGDGSIYMGQDTSVLEAVLETHDVAFDDGFDWEENFGIPSPEESPAPQDK